jgi:hypothetical protein
MESFLTSAGHGADVDRAEGFLAGRGSWAVPVGRMLPLVRAFTSIVEAAALPVPVNGHDGKTGAGRG